MKRVLILNCCYTSNFGDQAIGNAMKKMIDLCNAKPVLLDLLNVSQNKEQNCMFLRAVPVLPLADTNQQQGFISHYIKTIRKIATEVCWKLALKRKIKDACSSQYDYLFIGGGELIQSNSSFPFAIYNWIKEFKKRNRTAKIYFFGVGVTSIFSSKDRKLLNYALKEADGIFVRDFNSQRNMKEVFLAESILISDVVLGLHDPKETISEGYYLYGITSFLRIKKYGFQQLSTRSEYYEYCLKELQNLKQEALGANCRLFYSDIHDYYECVNFQKYAKEKYDVDIPLSKINHVYDFEKEIAGASMIVSPRMHACIFGLLYGKKVHMICISDKMKTFYDEYIQKQADIPVLRRQIINYAKELIE